MNKLAFIPFLASILLLSVPFYYSARKEKLSSNQYATLVSLPTLAGIVFLGISSIFLFQEQSEKLQIVAIAIASILSIIGALNTFLVVKTRLYYAAD